MNSDAMSCMTKVLTDKFNADIKSLTQDKDARITELKNEVEDLKIQLQQAAQQLIAKTEEAATSKAMAAELRMIAEVKADKKTWFEQADSMRKDMKELQNARNAWS